MRENALVEKSDETMTDCFDRSWAFSAETGEAYIPYLHDCIATEIRQNGSELSLFFPDGFWLLPDDPKNPYGDTLHRTGPSAAVVSMGYPKAEADAEKAVRAELFHQHCFCRGIGFTTVSFPKINTLIQKINTGRWSLEFVEKYPCYGRGYVVLCYFRTGKDMRQCYLNLDCRKIRFYWNEVSEDRFW